MKPWIPLRIAAALYALFTLGHAYGVLGASGRGPEEEAVYASMRNLTFNAMGFTRSHWSFYRGYGLIEIVHLAALAVLCWMAAGLSRADSRRARPLVVALLLATVAISALSWTYFFTGPGVVSTLAAICLAWAALACRTTVS